MKICNHCGNVNLDTDQRCEKCFCKFDDPDELISEIIYLINKGLKGSQIANELGIHNSTVQRLKKKIHQKE